MLCFLAEAPLFHSRTHGQYKGSQNIETKSRTWRSLCLPSTSPCILIQAVALGWGRCRAHQCSSCGHTSGSRCGAVTCIDLKIIPSVFSKCSWTIVIEGRKRWAVRKSKSQWLIRFWCDYRLCSILKDMVQALAMHSILSYWQKKSTEQHSSVHIHHSGGRKH